MDTPNSEPKLESLPPEILVNIFSYLDRESKLAVRSVNWNLLTVMNDSNLVKFCVHLSDETVETVANLTTKLPLSSLMVERLSKTWPTTASFPRTWKLAFRNGNSEANTIQLLKACSTFTSSLAFHGYSFDCISANGGVHQLNSVTQNWMTLNELQIMFNWPDDEVAAMDDTFLPAYRHFKSLNDYLKIADLPAIQRLTASVYLPMKTFGFLSTQTTDFKCSVNSFIQNNSSTLTEINLSFAGAVQDFGASNIVEPVRCMDNLLVYRAKLNTKFEQGATVIPAHLKLMQKLRILELSYESGSANSLLPDVCDLPEFRQIIESNCGSLESLTLNFPIRNLDWFPVCPKVKHFSIQGTADGTMPVNINHFPALARFSFARGHSQGDRNALIPVLRAAVCQFPDVPRLDAPFYRGVVLDELRQILRASKLTRLSLAMEYNCPGYIIFKRFCDKTPGLRFTRQDKRPLYYWDKKIDRQSGMVETVGTIHIDRSKFGKWMTKYF